MRTSVFVRISAHRRNKRVKCPLLAQSGPRLVRCTCLLLGGKADSVPARTRLDLTRHGSSHDLPNRVCWEDTFQKVPDFIGAGVEKPCPIRFTPESGHRLRDFTVASSHRTISKRAAYGATDSCSDPRIVKGLRRRPHRPAWDSNTPWQRAPQLPQRPPADRFHAVMSYQSRPISTAPQA